jgi:hypothetical protein
MAPEHLDLSELSLLMRLGEEYGTGESEKGIFAVLLLGFWSEWSSRVALQQVLVPVRVPLGVGVIGVFFIILLGGLHCFFL